MENRISHTGIITKISPNLISVSMQVEDACNTCEGHDNCRFASSTHKVVDITTPHWKEYQLGQAVKVNITHKQSSHAILLAYLLPALLIIATVTLLNHYKLNEMLIVLIAILSIGIYTLILYFLRNKIQHKFTFTISKLED